ncbi:MAG: CBS domain-containing protein [Phycisphaerae bacterium]|nr:CBS domain-containing protein [Phycisphaerae bacterium]NIP52829.1 CBS domain-containing protein [Phycisphaerae bacterium]NIS51850.1 CBS domain-containing protein [Phycisphaerae bacterium]NIU09368.1 CBS domain-containing protein [Phycisphaerae bacterium]NIU57601.1 CBS domain-containing protein [Phycisphaerae bacterium]
MIHTFVSASADIFEHFNLALLFGLIILGGTFGARLFQKFHIPQVVGCIVVGILLGDVLKVITPTTIESLEPLMMFALGLIGFMIGAELRAEVFRKYGRQFFIILFSQGFGAFLLVAIAGSAVVWLALPSIVENIGATQRVYTSLAMGLLLGAIASATAPAATVNVLWEYKTKGPLTAAVLAIVALDDALALLLYRGAATGAKALMGTSQSSVLNTTLILLAEILGAIVLGILAGVLLFYLLKFVRADDKILEFAISCLLLVVGISMIPKIDPILPAMAFGITIANLMPRQSKGTFQLVEKFSPPVYTAFFVLAGAHMQFGKLSFWMLIMIGVYTLFRAAGKIFGSWFGARYSGSAAAVRKYLGICLLPQAGVAIGLAILAGQQFDTALGHTIIMVIMTATFLMEILGPMLVKVGVKKAGEVGLNITEEDLIKTYKVADVMDKQMYVIFTGMSLSEVIQLVSNTNSFYYPVVDSDKKLVGAITLDNIRNTFATQELNDWLVALDIMEPVIATVTQDIPLSEAFEQTRRLDIEHLPVVTSDEDNTLVSILNCRGVRRSLSAEVLSRQQKADSIHKEDVLHKDTKTRS